MKQFLPILCLFIVACGKPAQKNPTDNFQPKKDTVEVTIRATPKGPVYSPMLAAYQTYINYTPKDTLKPSDTIARIKSVIDTMWQVKITDTMRDAAKNPVYDSLHHIRYQTTWQAVSKNFIQIIDVPRQ